MVPVINYRIQGVIPKRKTELARTIGITVENNLLSYDDLVDKLLSNDLKDEIVNAIKAKAGETVDKRLLEGIILQTASNELKHIEYLGGILGFVIGCAQVAIMHMLRVKLS